MREILWSELKKVRTVCLLSVLGTTLGWGKSKNQDVGLPRELQELEVPIVTLETCQRTYGWLEIRGPNKTRLNDSRVVTETMICAGGLDGAGTCTYDSGESSQSCNLR